MTDERIELARRIRLGMLAAADRAAGIDTSVRRPLIDLLPALESELAGAIEFGRAGELLREDVPRMLALLASIRVIVDGAKDGTALAWLDAFASIRDVLYPDTDVARRLNERRRMTPEQHAAERERADASEREAWAGVKPTDEVHGDPLRPCAECGRLTQFELCAQCADPDTAGHA